MVVAAARVAAGKVVVGALVPILVPVGGAGAGSGSAPASAAGGGGSSAVGGGGCSALQCINFPDSFSMTLLLLFVYSVL